MPPQPRCLLALDLGLRAGFALFRDDRQLLWYRSTNFGSRARMRRAAFPTLASIEGLDVLVVEGDRTLAEPWRKAAVKRGVEVLAVAPEVWREQLLFPRQRRSGADAKRYASELARRVIDASGARNPSSLRHDAAEAILIGQWALAHLGWQESR